jgi:hypothetical protein
MRLLPNAKGIDFGAGAFAGTAGTKIAGWSSITAPARDGMTARNAFLPVRGRDEIVEILFLHWRGAAGSKME